MATVVPIKVASSTGPSGARATHLIPPASHHMSKHVPMMTSENALTESPYFPTQRIYPGTNPTTAVPTVVRNDMELIIGAQQGHFFDAGYLLVDVTSTSATAVVHPSWATFATIAVTGNNGLGPLLCNITPFELLFYLRTLPWSEKKRLGHLMGMNPWTLRSDERVMASGATRTYLIPIPPWSPIHNLHIRHMRTDLRFVCSTNTNFKKSGSGVITLSNLRLVVKERAVLFREAQMELQQSVGSWYHRLYNQVHVYVHPVMTVTAGTKFVLPLESITGMMKQVVLIPLASMNELVPSSPLRLGLDTTFDILTPQGTSVFANGYAATLRDMDMLSVGRVTSEENLFENYGAITIRMSDDQNTYRPSRRGYMWTINTKNEIAITPAAAITDTVWTFTSTTSTDNDGGSFCILFGGQVTSELTYASTAAAVKAALEALPVSRKHGLIFTVSAAFVDDVAITVTCPSFDPALKFGPPSLINSTLTQSTNRENGRFTETTQWTPGTVGSGSAVYWAVVVFILSECMVSHMGEFTQLNSLPATAQS